MLLPACRAFVARDKRRRITWEYVMIDGVNDDLVRAKHLIRLLEGIPFKLNLWPNWSVGSAIAAAVPHRGPWWLRRPHHERQRGRGTRATISRLLAVDVLHRRWDWKSGCSRYRGGAGGWNAPGISIRSWRWSISDRGRRRRP